MTERALVRFAEKVATKLSETLLEALRTKRFSEWGAMKLRNEVCGRHVFYQDPLLRRLTENVS